MGNDIYSDTLESLTPAPTPQPATPAPSIYDDTIRLQDQSTQQTVRRAMVQAAPTSPTRAADVQQLSQKTGLPADVVDRNYDDIAKRARLADIPYADLAKNSPALSQRLADPSNAALMRDELAPLGQIEASTRHVAAAPSFAAQMYGAAQTGYNDVVASAMQLGAAYGLVDPQRAASIVAAANTRAAARRAELPDYAKEFQTTMAAKGADVNNAVQAFRAAHSDSFVTQALDKFKAGAYTVGETLDMIRAAAVRPRGLLYSTVEGLASMVPMIAGSAAGAELGAAVGTAIAPGPGTAIGGVVGMVGGTFTGTAPGAVGQEINRGLAARGIDITNPQALASAYGNPSLMAEIRAKAQTKGLTNAAVVALVSAFAGKFSGMAEDASLPTRAVAGAADVSVQAGGMGAAQLASEAAVGEKPDVGGAVQTAVSTLAFSVAESALGAARRGVFSRDPMTAAHEAAARADEALSAEQNVQALGAIGEAVKNAPTTARVPEQFKALIDTATGGDAESATAVYFTPAEWDTYWQSAKTSPAQAAADVMGDGGKAYYAAKSTDTALAIPLGDYVAKVATTAAHWDGLLPAARMTPDGMTLGEAREYLQSLPATLKAIADEAAGQPTDADRQAADDVARTETAARVRADVEQQLLNAGATPSVAKAQSQVLESGFRTLAERVGRDPHELYSRYLKSITREDASPAGQDNVLDQQPRPEFVAVGDEAKENTDRQLTLAADQASRELLIQSGEADARKLTFRDAVRQTQARSELADQARGLGPAEGGSVRTGLDQSIRGMADGVNSTTLDQSSVETEAFKKWFGNSTLVDENGKPRVLYHGTAEDFDRFEMSKTGKGRGAKNEKAFFFSATPDTANHSAEVAGIGKAEFGGKMHEPPAFIDTSNFEQKGSVVYPVYLKLENPFISTMEGYNSRQMAKEIREAKKAGHDGIMFPRMNSAGESDTIAVFSPEQIKSAIGNKGTFDPNDPSILAQEKRGSIHISPTREMTIALAKDADPSTFIHETGHLYVEVLHDLAAAADAPADLKADLGTLRDWVGAEGDTPLSRDQHEQIARGFEAYLMEGKAPSEALRGAFFRFKTWLLKIYANVSALNVELTPDVRRVFDRLLASHDEIVRAESSTAMEPLFEDPRAAGMTEAQAASYTTAVAEARQSAEEALTVKLMKQMRREQSKEWAAWRTPIEADVTKEVDASPLYRAMAALREGTKPDGSPLDEGLAALKLHRESVKAMTALTPEQAADLVRKGYTSPDGVHPDLAAEAFGFPDGGALMKALATAPDRATAIETATDAKIQAVHGDRLTDEKLRGMATEAVRSEQHVQVLRKELEILASDHLATLKGLVRAVTKPVPPTEELRRQAATIIDQTAVRAVRPDVFDAAATRAARDAREALLRGDVAGAFDAKRHEMLAIELYRGAAEAKQDVQDAMTRFAKLRRPDAKIAETRNLDLVNAGRAVLARFGIGTAGRADVGLDQLLRYDPGAHEQLQATIAAATAHAGPYKTIPIRDFRAMASTVDALWALARQAETIEVNGERQQLAAVRQAVVDQFQRFHEPQEKAGYTKALSNRDKARPGLLGFKAHLTRLESWVTTVDNGREGIARSAIFDPVNEGAIEYDSQRVNIARFYADEVAKKLDTERRYRDIEAPELGDYTFKDKHQALLGALLHLGNGFEPGSNGYKLLRGYGWGDLNEDGTVDASRWKAFEARMQREGILTKADYDYAQAVWTLNESVKPAAQRAHKARFGRYFDEVTAVPFDTPFGHYEGGYYPAVADPLITPSEKGADDSFIEGGSGGAGMFPTVGRGFTNTRTLGYAKPLILDASMVLSHVNAVLRFAYLSEPVHAVARLVLHPAFHDGTGAIDPALVSDLLKPYLVRAASQRMFLPSQSKLGRLVDDAARAVRVRGSMQIMAANATVLIEQVLHPMTLLAHPDVSGTKVLGALWRLSREPHVMAEDVHTLSPYMATRESEGLIEARAAIDRILLDPNPAQRAARWVTDHTTVITRTIQSAMDLATWQAAFDTVSERPEFANDPERAAKRADTVIREVLGSYRPQDRSAIEGGNQAAGLLNMFYGFQSTRLNFLGTEAVLASRLSLSRKYARAFALYTFGLMVPGLAVKAVKTSMGKQPYQQNGESDAEAAVRFWAESQEEQLTRMLPFGVGAGADIAIRSMLHWRMHGELLNAPAITMVTDALRGPGEEFHALHDANATPAQKAKARLDMFTLLGMLSGQPMRPVGQAINVAADHANP